MAGHAEIRSGESSFVTFGDPGVAELAGHGQFTSVNLVTERDRLGRDAADCGGWAGMLSLGSTVLAVLTR